jgi:hypothetical protein
MLRSAAYSNAIQPTLAPRATDGERSASLIGVAMPIHFTHEEIILVTPERVFAVIDELPVTAKWLPPCVSLEKVGVGPNKPGDDLRYVYKQGGSLGEMVGVILDRIPNERLHCKYFDSMFEVSVDLRVSSCPEGATTIHAIKIWPKTFIGHLMGPLIRMGLRKQTRDAARNLKALLELPGPV